MVNCCPLCGSAEAVTVETVETPCIWKALEVNHGAYFSESIQQALMPFAQTALLACQGCGLQYFSPACPGDADFYSQLTADDPDFYNNETWDFRQALQLLPGSAKVLDVACGAGAFLELARSHGVEAYGIDTNPLAVESAQVRGLSVECTTLLDFSRRHAAAFNAVTAFQVLEHLIEVVPFMCQAASCLKPGGQLLVSVPNRHRIWREPLEPLDCPPHHLSRWSAPQFAVLADRCGLQLQAVHCQLATRDHLRNQLRQRISPRFSKSLPVRALAKGLINGLTVPDRLLPSLFGALRLWDLSMLAVLVKPSR
jgi:SAM-dependent methyltransferase